MLEQDESGRNYFYDALQDPVNRTKAAWFILNGEDAFEQIAEYYNQKIKLVAQNQYKKGLEDGQNKQESKPKTVFAKQNNNRPQLKEGEHLDISNLDDF